MINWEEYLKNILDNPIDLDEVILGCFDKSYSFSPIIKASIQMLEQMIETEGRHNIFVFPETKHLIYELLLSKAIFNISIGKIKSSYDPKNFVKGQKLKYKNCFMIFDHFEYVNSQKQEYIFFKFSDGGYAVPVSIAPFLQVTDSKKLSKRESFTSVYSALDAKEKAVSGFSSNIIERLSDYKTHLDGSIFFISNVKNTKSFLANCTLNQSPLSDILYVAHSNGDGDLLNVFPGQLTGNPAIVIAPDLYAVQNAAKRGANIQSIIVDLSLPNIIENQLDVLDELIKSDFPILCISDTCNSFNMDLLTERRFNLWRWDKNTITESVQESSNSVIKSKLQNCAKQNINYSVIDNERISESISILSSYRNQVEELSQGVITLFDKMFSYAFFLLRNIIPLSGEENKNALDDISECSILLENEKKYISAELYNDLKKIIENIKDVYSSGDYNEKHDKIFEIIESRRYSSICIIIPEKTSKERCIHYWQNTSIRRHLPARISVLYPQEFKNSKDDLFDLTIIVGWLNSSTMRSVLHSYPSMNFEVLLYSCEERWKRSNTSNWKKALNKSDNKRLIKSSFSKDKLEISTDTFEEYSGVQVALQPDELSEIELTINTSKYKRYASQNINDVVDAFPISFVGGGLAFFRSEHKVITVSDIITEESDDIKNKKPSELQPGDFVVMRESEKDVIREIADEILKNSGKEHLRGLASKWKDALAVESIFSPVEDIHDRLKAAGCTKDLMTIKNWISNDELIMPQSKDDLMYIAQITADSILEEKIDEIFDAGRVVKAAHIKAGKYLSALLKGEISEKIQTEQIHDPYNIWDPIVLQLDKIGTVKILKVIDIGELVPVDVYNTNKLLSNA